MSIPDTPATRKLITSGTATVTGLDAPTKKRGKVELVDPSFQLSACWTIPLETRCEVNGRDWRARNRRSGAAWKTVRESVFLSFLVKCEMTHFLGSSVYARLTRLAPSRLDPGNLPTALKGVEDAVCYLIGIDDGSPLWKPVYEQEKNPRYGVRVELSTEPFGGPS